MLPGTSSDRAAWAAIAAGAALAAAGEVLEARFGHDYGAAIRALGGMGLIAGLLVLGFWEPRRRAAVIGRLRGIAEAYWARTADWRMGDRLGLAGVAVGLGLAVPAIALQLLFRQALPVMIPALVLFWGGIALIAWERYRRGREAESMRPGDDRTRSEERGRWWGRR